MSEPFEGSYCPRCRREVPPGAHTCRPVSEPKLSAAWDFTLREIESKLGPTVSWKIKDVLREQEELRAKLAAAPEKIRSRALELYYDAETETGGEIAGSITAAVREVLGVEK